MNCRKRLANVFLLQEQLLNEYRQIIEKMPILELAVKPIVFIKTILKYSVPIVFIIFLFIQDPTYAFDQSMNYRITSSNTNILASLKYEAKEPTSLENPVTDPNFNVMRNKEIGKSKAIPLVVGVLIVAIAAPIATWMYFSN